LVTAGNIDLRVLQGPLHLSPRIRVDSFPVPHRGGYSETLGFRVTGPRASLLYVPDTDGWADWEMPVEEHLESVDIAFLDATFFTREELPGRDMAMIAHPPVIDSLRRFAELGDGERKKIHFTHLNHTNPLLRSGSDEYTRVLRAGMMVATERQLIDL
jgi:pyrroloquinoline quinone biosynthesis protein B